PGAQALEHHRLCRRIELIRVDPHLAEEDPVRARHRLAAQVQHPLAMHAVGQVPQALLHGSRTAPGTSLHDRVAEAEALELVPQRKLHRALLDGQLVHACGHCPPLEARTRARRSETRTKSRTRWISSWSLSS